jgi:1-acyl-sn-glycerol-3-phosphate acyltransferase
MLFLRSLLFQIAFYVATVLLMLVWLPALVMRRHASLELGRAWGRVSHVLLDKICGLKVEYRGVENIPPGALIVACKHQSTWDTFTLPPLFPDFSYILKRELVYLPFFGWYLLAAEQIGIDRARGGKLLPQLVAKAKALFAQNRQLFIFPEGTRRPIGAAPEYKYGVAHLYRETGVRVLPVALNAGIFWGRRKFLIHPGVAVMEFLPVIEPGLETRAFFELLQERIETASNRLIDEAVARNPALAKALEEGRREAAESTRRKGERRERAAVE